ncbi:MAG: DUF3368 domain-containing protein [Verrucomicrobia bacterium]|nr:DUF3368 domain-containing protein [Verrucomicrobiota bacterium]
MASAVSDASVLIHLAGIGQLDLLSACFERVLVPDAVWREVVVQGRSPDVVQAVEAASQQGWLARYSPASVPLLRHLRQSLHEGEAEAICLALETGPDMLLMDETDGRVVARSLGMRTQGVVGLLLQAKQAGRLTAIRPLLDQLVQHRFYLNPEFVRQILQQAGEHWSLSGGQPVAMRDLTGLRPCTPVLANQLRSLQPARREPHLHSHPRLDPGGWDGADPRPGRLHHHSPPRGPAARPGLSPQ